MSLTAFSLSKFLYADQFVAELDERDLLYNLFFLLDRCLIDDVIQGCLMEPESDLVGSHKIWWSGYCSI